MIPAANDRCARRDPSAQETRPSARWKTKTEFSHSLKVQQSMSRKNLSREKKFSQNWKRAKARLACLHIRVANARRDYRHKASTAISKNHAIVCVEDLRVSNLSSSAAGSRQSPGSKVRAKSGLNQSILDQGWVNCGVSWNTSWPGTAAG